MLSRIALRICAIEALKGKTWVGMNVLDSELGALDIGADGTVRTDQDKPFVTVYSEQSRAENGLSQRGLHAVGTLDIVFEIGIAAAMVELDNETGESHVAVGIPATDRAFEFYLDVVGRQIVNALSDPNNVWAEIWRGLFGEIRKIDRRRTGDSDKLGRIAAHQIVVTVDPYPDPVFGGAIAEGSIWKRFFDQMAVSEHSYAPALLDLVGGSTGPLDHENQRRRFGLTIGEARALMDIALQPGEATEPDISSVSFDKVP